MNKLFFFFFVFIGLTGSLLAQPDLLDGKTTNAALQKKLDSALQSRHYITVEDATTILEKPAHLKDSTYKYSGGILRYSFTYVANFVDSTSKGKLFFGFEQYQDAATAKAVYQSVKTQNANTGAVTEIADLGDEAFLQKDALNQPFIFIRDNTKTFKLRIYYLTTPASLNELKIVAKKIVAAH